MIGSRLGPGSISISEGAEQARAWTVFWDEQGAESRCLEHASPEVHRALSAHWLSFAESFGAAAKVLDIGCGAGSVARTLVAAHPDLQVTGVDLALVPSAQHPRIELLAATPMESLPFAEASFHAAVSQYGFEYGQIEEAARELARVLTRGARFSFLVHHAESSIVRSDRIHNLAIRALTGDPVRLPFLSGDVGAFDRQMRLLSSQYPSETTIELAARRLRSCIARGDDQKGRIWEAVVDALAPDRALSDALQSCCVAPHELNDWLAPLQEMFEVVPPSVISVGEPLAWKIEGMRAGRSVSTDHT